MKEKVKCPMCGKRIFDLCLRGKAAISIKCAHCKTLVVIKKDGID